MSNFTAMALAYPFPLPGYEPPQKPKHQPTYYLSDEATALRMAALVDRLAKAGKSHPDYARVPASVRAEVDRRMSETVREAA